MMNAADEEMKASNAFEGCDPMLIDFNLNQELTDQIEDAAKAQALVTKIELAREKNLADSIRDWGNVYDYTYALTEAYLTYQLGRCLMRMKKYPEAISTLKEATEMAKQLNYKKFSFACYNSLAFCLDDSGNRTEGAIARQQAKHFQE